MTATASNNPREHSRTACSPTTTFMNGRRCDSDDEATMVLRASCASSFGLENCSLLGTSNRRRCLMSELRRSPNKGRPAVGRRRTLLHRRCHSNHDQKRNKTSQSSEVLIFIPKRSCSRQNPFVNGIAHGEQCKILTN